MRLFTRGRKIEMPESLYADSAFFANCHVVTQHAQQLQVNSVLDSSLSVSMSAAPETRVCAVGDFTSKLAVSYLSHVASYDDTNEGTDGAKPSLSLNPTEKLKKAFQAVDLPVSSNQVSQLLEATSESSQCSASHGEGERENQQSVAMSWGEFCVCCVEVKCLLAQQETDSSAKKPPVVKPPSVQRSGCKCEVFLGGSCNPTTWRRDTVIPALKAAGVTYFNPQVEEWYPELIEVEEQAKQSASMLFFVIDNHTRAISSMVEIAYFAGIGRDLVVVVEDMKEEGSKVGGDPLCKREVEDLNRGRAFVRNLLEEGGSLLGASLHEATQATVDIMKQGVSIAEYSASSRPLRVPPSRPLGDTVRLLHQVFTMYDPDRRGRLSLQEAEIALRSLSIDIPVLFSLLGSKSISRSHDQCEQSHDQSIQSHDQSQSLGVSSDLSHDLLLQYQESGLSFEDFCTVYSELRYRVMESERGGRMGLSLIASPLKWLASLLWTIPPGPENPPTFCDVFLGGSCGSSTWRRNIAIPILKQHGVSYFNPQLPHWDMRMMPVEREAKEHCTVLLFVVCGDTLSVASMVEAAYYIGKCRNMVLCMSEIPQKEGESTEIEGMKLSKRAVKDYNRGRAYLASMANKARLPVYSSVSDAVLNAVYLVKGSRVYHRSSSSGPLSGTSV